MRSLGQKSTECFKGGTYLPKKAYQGRREMKHQEDYNWSVNKYGGLGDNPTVKPDSQALYYTIIHPKEGGYSFQAEMFMTSQNFM